MVRQSTLLPALALGAGALILLPAQETRAWSTIGGSLAQNQRDFRVYNNFSDPEDNDNQVADPMFPGHQGAVLAIWKASVEWGSLPHGDGSGDPTQLTLGSGGANFDASFQSLATQVGGTNDNTHSEISGSNGGVLAYTETPISDGWRIRYYQAWNWADGPGSIFYGEMDLQGVACHEYGHALGLGHSSSSSATMSPSVSSGVTSLRSISSDDRAGVQSIYGVMDPGKPVITGIQVSGGQIHISGSGFDPTGNQVWFTQAATGGTGMPIKITNMASNGTLLSATIPTFAGPGDVLVRRNNSSHTGLSNAWPTNLQEGGGVCPAPTNYCSGSLNSSGGGASIGFSGSGSLTSNNLTLTAAGCPPLKSGLFFYGPDQSSTPVGNGLLCVGGATTRLAVIAVNLFGGASSSLNLAAPPFTGGPGAAIPGQSMNFQFWYRDPAAGGSGFNFSDGLHVTFCP